MMSGGFLSDMNAKVRQNLGMRKRGSYFRSEKDAYVDPKKYKKGYSHKKPTKEELEAIRQKVSKLAKQDQQKLKRQIIIAAILFVIIISMLVYFGYQYFNHFM